MRASGVEVDRPRQPSSLALVEDEKEIESADSYPVKVWCTELGLHVPY